MGKSVDVLAGIVLPTKDGEVLLLAAIVDDVAVSVSKTAETAIVDDDATVSMSTAAETAANSVVVEYETIELWVDTPEVVVVALGAKLNVADDALGVGLAVDKTALEEDADTTSDSSM